MNLLNTPIEETQQTVSGFSYSNAAINDDVDEVTLTGISVDLSGSTIPFRKDLEAMLMKIVEKLKKESRSENIHLRVEGFDSVVNEIHGFVCINDINQQMYQGKLNSSGATALYDAYVSTVESVGGRAKTLVDNFDYMVNGVVYQITDGLEFGSRKYMSPKLAKEAADLVIGEERLESLNRILVGIGDGSSVRAGLEEYADKAGFDKFIWFGEATEENLGMVADNASENISSQSSSLGSGGPSKIIDPNDIDI